MEKRLARACSAFPGGLDDKPLLDGLPRKMKRASDRDIAFTGIRKRDSAGRTVDIHCLRHTFITNLARSGVSLQVAQKAARHSSPVLTSNIYTHLRLDDIAEAVKKLPDFTGGTAQVAEARKVALNVAPAGGRDSQNLTVCGSLCGVQTSSTLSAKTHKKPNKNGIINGGGFSLGLGKSLAMVPCNDTGASTLKRQDSGILLVQFPRAG